MLKLGERGKIVCLAIAVQLGCLATGLWIHHRFVFSSLQHAARQSAWTALEALCETQAANWLSARDSGTPHGNPDSRPASNSTPDTFPGGPARLLLVDLDWRVVVAPGNVERGAQLKWSPLESTADHGPPPKTIRPGQFVRGTVIMPDGIHLAAARRTDRHDGFIVALCRADAIAVSPQTVAGSLLGAGAISFLWVAGVLGIATYLIVTRLCDRHARDAAETKSLALHHAESMSRMRDAVIFGLAKLTESRDPETGYHLERIALFSERLAQAMRGHWKFSDLITPEFVRLIESSSILHDIGKVGVEDSVLLKPGPLNPEERERMQRHAVVGGKCLADIESRLGRSNFLQMAREIAYSHHERWDGSGYPQGLAREQIPLAARIVTVVDVYEALSSKRIYKEALPHEECVAYIRDQGGKHFDPHIVEVFLQIQHHFRDIGVRLSYKHHTAKESAAVDLRSAPYAPPPAGAASGLAHCPHLTSPV